VKRVSRATSEWAATKFSLTVYKSPRLFGLTNPFANCASSFGGYIRMGSSQFFLTVYESRGTVWADESIHHL
jgi:hypothetical protein